MASILVYAELNQGKVATTSLELMTKARVLGDVYAVVLGAGAKAAAATLGKHGAKAVHVNEDPAFDDYIRSELERSFDVLSTRGAVVAYVTAPYYLRGERPDGGRWPEELPA